MSRLHNGRDAIRRAYQNGRFARKKLIAELEQDMQVADAGAPSPVGFSDDATRLAHLISRDSTIRLAFVALGGWDKHVAEGSVKGQLSNHLSALGDGLASFAKQLGPAYSDTVVLVISEFGRTVHENANVGTDHGHGNVMWVMCGPVRGGKIYGRWPGLSKAELHQERDLPVTTDFREAVGDVPQTHIELNAAQVDPVFPNRPPATPSAPSLIKA